LYISTGSGQPKRLQGVFISEDEVKRVVGFLKMQKREDGNEEDLLDDIAASGSPSNLSRTLPTADSPFSIDDAMDGDHSSEDELYMEAKDAVIRAGKASASLLQRRLRIGYSRAARILDLLEEDGVIGPSDGAKPREVYASGTGEDAGQEGDDKEEEENPFHEQEKRDKWQM
jgi:S-DNA-T family DNA segregation ATPase FtsK/SpoIIIE